RHLSHLHSSPQRRSSDLAVQDWCELSGRQSTHVVGPPVIWRSRRLDRHHVLLGFLFAVRTRDRLQDRLYPAGRAEELVVSLLPGDRKSTRLNSSHQINSY